MDSLAQRLVDAECAWRLAPSPATLRALLAAVRALYGRKVNETSE